MFPSRSKMECVAFKMDDFLFFNAQHMKISAKKTKSLFCAFHKGFSVFCIENNGVTENLPILLLQRPFLCYTINGMKMVFLPPFTVYVRLCTLFASSLA